MRERETDTQVSKNQKGVCTFLKHDQANTRQSPWLRPTFKRCDDDTNGDKDQKELEQSLTRTYFTKLSKRKLCPPSTKLQMV